MTGHPHLTTIRTDRDTEDVVWVVADCRTCAWWFTSRSATTARARARRHEKTGGAE